MSLYVPITFSQIQPLIDSGVSEFEILDVLRKVAIKYTKVIQKDTPVDTGRLRRSMRIELLPDNRGLAVTSEVFYAGFVEYGTRKMRPRSFVESNIPAIIDAVIEGLSTLGSVTKGTVKQFDNDETLYSGLTTQRISQLNRVINNLVTPRSVGKLSVQPTEVNGNQVQNIEVTNEVAA